MNFNFWVETKIILKLSELAFSRQQVNSHLQVETAWNVLQCTHFGPKVVSEGREWHMLQSMDCLMPTVNVFSVAPIVAKFGPQRSGTLGGTYVGKLCQMVPWMPPPHLWLLALLKYQPWQGTNFLTLVPRRNNAQLPSWYSCIQLPETFPKLSLASLYDQVWVSGPLWPKPGRGGQWLQVFMDPKISHHLGTSIFRHQLKAWFLHML